jgi:hypothetical protein
VAGFDKVAPFSNLDHFNDNKIQIESAGGWRYRAAVRRPA